MPLNRRKLMDRVYIKCWESFDKTFQARKFNETTGVDEGPLDISDAVSFHGTVQGSLDSTLGSSYFQPTVSSHPDTVNKPATEGWYRAQMDYQDTGSLQANDYKRGFLDFWYVDSSGKHKSLGQAPWGAEYSASEGS